MLGTVASTSSGNPQQEFKFEYNPARPFETMNPANRELSEKWEKWGLSPKVMQLKAFQFDNLYRRGMADDFILSLFQSPEVQTHVQLGDGRGGTTAFPTVNTAKVHYRELTTNAISLDLFNPAVENENIVRGDDGDVRRMMDVYLPDGITVSDQWRSLFMLGEESEYYDTFSEEQKREFLYHLMWRIVAGGALNQWEDSVNVYKDFAREFYKDLVSVGRDSATGTVQVTSHVFQVFEVNGGDVPLFPKECGDVDVTRSNFNYFYVVVNPTRREAIVWYNSFWSPF